MENGEKRNLKISGAGSAAGGSYDEVRISGAGEVNGDVECNYLKTSGASEIKGNVKAATVETSGASEIRGNLTTENVTTSGASEIKGDLKAKKVKVSGASQIGGNLEADNVEIRGSIEIGGNCEAENFDASGAFDIKGLLNAGDIDVRVYGKCKAKEIGGEKIKVTKGEGTLASLQKLINTLINKKEFLMTDLIEGDEIFLESTIAKTVRGSKITIGSDCEIDVVEYKDEIKVDGNARIREQRRI